MGFSGEWTYHNREVLPYHVRGTSRRYLSTRQERRDLEIWLQLNYVDALWLPLSNLHKPLQNASGP